MQANIKGPWSEAEIEQFLCTSVFPLRLAAVGADGYPRVTSVWFRYTRGQLLCVSHRSAKLISLLNANARVGFEIAPNEPPYHGVRGQGRATVSELGEQSVLEDLLERYLGGAESKLGHWLLSRKEDEMLITITPRRWFSWDYRERMADVALPDSNA